MQERKAEHAQKCICKPSDFFYGHIQKQTEVYRHIFKEVFKVARKYDHEYKVQAVKLAKEIGGAKAAKELGIPEGTIHTWLKAVRASKLDIGEGSHTPASAMSLSEEITMLRKRVKEQDKEIRRLKEENEFLEEASAFFAASRRKSAKTRE